MSNSDDFNNITTQVPEDTESAVQAAETAAEATAETTAQAAETVTETVESAEAGAAVQAAEAVSEAAAEVGQNAPEPDSRYDKYIGVSWNGSSYSGRPAGDAAYSYGSGAPSQGYSYGGGAPSQGYSYGSGAPSQGYSYGSGAPSQGYSYGGGIPDMPCSYSSNAPVPDMDRTTGTSNINYSGTASSGYNNGTGYNSGAGCNGSSDGAAYNGNSSGTGYTNNGGAGYGYVSEPVRLNKSRKDRHMPKWLSAVLLAALFGLVAAGVFIGTNKLYYTLNPSSVPETASNVADTAADSTVKSSSVVASTPIITNVSTTPADVSAVVEAVMPSIVSIECTFNTQSFFGTYESSGAGSGIILKSTDTELLIATNNHVIENATSINVRFIDDSYVSAVTKGTDATADLAVISISLEDMSEETLAAICVATLGSSDDVKVGQMAIAIGNAMGYGQSTTVGYISAKDREVTVDGNTMTLLQTDAAINPGNSGGALLNLNGEVIGINSVKYADSDVEGMGFAIPISRATAILDELAAREILSDEEKGYLGVYLQDITSSISQAYNWPMGIYVASVVDGGAAQAAGICAGDIITGVNGASVLTSTDLKNSITSHRAGTVVQITFQRLSNGAFTEHTVDVTLGVNPEYAE